MTSRYTERLGIGTNPYFAAYALAHGRTVAGIVEADRAEWPGGRMVGFLLWMSRRWRQWGALRGLHRDGGGAWYDAAGRHVLLSEEDHAHFGGWLRGWAGARAETLSAPVSSRLEHGPTCTIGVPVFEHGRRRYPCICNCGAEARA